MKLLKQISKLIFGGAFILAGVNHFLNPDFYVRIMPPFLPVPLFVVYLSGIFEIALGVLLLVPKFSRLAAYGLVALLLAVFPANIYMALNPHLFTEFSPAALYLRLPLQMGLIVWAFWYSKKDK
jgi:uncharacterized membrane protein